VKPIEERKMEQLIAEYRRLEKNLQNATEERQQVAIYVRMMEISLEIFAASPVVQTLFA
jgi:hypothetical protein